MTVFVMLVLSHVDVCRLQDELALRLERERTQREISEMMEIKRLWYEELCRKKDEEAREEIERNVMAFEDHLSSHPPKTRGPKPRVSHALIDP